MLDRPVALLRYVVPSIVSGPARDYLLVHVVAVSVGRPRRGQRYTERGGHHKVQWLYKQSLKYVQFYLGLADFAEEPEPPTK